MLVSVVKEVLTWKAKLPWTNISELF